MMMYVIASRLKNGEAIYNRTFRDCFVTSFLAMTYAYVYVLFYQLYNRVKVIGGFYRRITEDALFALVIVHCFIRVF